MAIYGVFRLGWKDMEHLFETVKCGIVAALLLLMSICLTACATLGAAPVSQVERADGAVSLPYRISSSGRFLIDVSVDSGAARPMAVDTGATISVVYSDFVQSSNLTVSDRTLFVRGLVGQGDRPVIEDVAFKLGPQVFPLDQVVMLETPIVQDEAIGLIGGDILRGYIVLFNQKDLRASFIPRQNLTAEAFAGWSKIPLRTFQETETNTQLYFATTKLDKKDVPVLIDTGSNFNFINWQLAKMDKDILKLERKLRKDGLLQGALDSTPYFTETVFYDLKLGREHWDQIDVTVMALETLTAVTPADEPMIVAGAAVFAPRTIAFDLEGRRMYIYPEPRPRKATDINPNQIRIFNGEGR